MWLASALPPVSEVAAFESFLEGTEGFQDTDEPNEEAPLTTEPEDNSPEDNEEVDPDEDELDEDELEDEDIPTAADAEADAEGEADPDAPDVSTLDSLADFFEVEPEEVLQNLEVEGLEGEMVSIGDALDGWRESERIFEDRATSLEADHRTLLSSTQEASNQHLQRVAILTKSLIDRIQVEYSGERMAAARMENPEHYADLVDGKNAAEKLINDSIGVMDQEGDKREAQSSADLHKIMAKQNDLLLKARPEWKNPDTLNSALKAGTKYMLGNGWAQSDIDSIQDHRVLLMVDDAVKGARLRRGSDGKLVDKLRRRGLKQPTKGLKARSRRDQPNPKNRARDKAYARLEESGDAKDAVDLFLDRM
jgi:hypothetical protein